MILSGSMEMLDLADMLTQTYAENASNDSSVVDCSAHFKLRCVRMGVPGLVL